MTTLLFDTGGMDQTAGMISDSAGEYEVLASQIAADADLGAMPPEVSAFVGSELASISQALRESAWSLSSDAQLLAWRSEAARLADDPSLSALAEMLFGAGTTIGASGLFTDLTAWGLGDADPLALPAGCACSLTGYGIVNYDPSAQGSETVTSSAWGEGSYQSSYVGESGDTIQIKPIDLGSSDSGYSVDISVQSPDLGSGSTGLVVPITIPDVGYVDPSAPNVFTMNIPDPVIYTSVIPSDSANEALAQGIVANQAWNANLAISAEGRDIQTGFDTGDYGYRYSYP